MKTVANPALGGVAAAALFAGSAQAAVNLNGDTTSLEWGVVFSGAWTQASLTPSSTGGFLNTFGPTTVGGSTPTFADPALGVDVNVSGDQVVFTENAGDVATIFFAFPFNGAVLHDQNQAIVGARVGTSSVPGFTNSDIGVVNGDLWVNFSNLTISSGESVSITLTPSGSAPEPGGWSLFILGFGLLGASLRRARQSTVQS